MVNKSFTQSKAANDEVAGHVPADHFLNARAKTLKPKRGRPS